MRRHLAVALLSVTACGNDADPDLVAERQLPPAVTADVQAVSTANNQFALDMLRVLPPAENQFFSPFSISTALWMLDAGAAGDTDAELRAALHATLPGTQAHEAYGAMLDSLEVGRSFDLYTLATANRLFGQDGLAFQQPFLDLTADAYGAPLQPVDFRTDARDTINAWVSEQTDAMIPELFDELDGDTVLVLANAIVFKGKWTQAFDRARTRPAPFTLASGAQVDVSMMSKSDLLRRARIDGGQLGVMSFRGRDLSMVVLVPDEASGLPALEARLTADSLVAAITGASGEETVNVRMPKFSFEAELPLPQTLQALGVTAAFDPARADLSGIDGTRSLFVTSAVHKAVIAVDEDGAEAAAGTGVSDGPVSFPPELVLDRPFLFLIHDHVTGSILFLGRVNDPR
ncbi:MAG TPA: serpin family protein [Kofleriaceae bacterium]|nr:serpin family protein [Kofleriaceae bacterium]